MHELSIAESVIEQICERLPNNKIAAVRLRIGELSGVVPSAISFCFDVAAAGTAADGARLDIDETLASCRCDLCGQVFRPPDQLLLCPCGSAAVTVLAGDELQIESVEVVEVV